MDTAVIPTLAAHPVVTRFSGWTPNEENLLYRIVRSENLNGRTSTGAWQKIADRLAAEGASLGIRLRTASSVRHRAVKIGAYARDRVPSQQIPDPVVVLPTNPPATLAQASFAAPEVKAEVNRALVAILRKIADEMEAAHG